MNSHISTKPGSLIHARGREWVVLPDSSDDLLIVRPVGGLDEEITGLIPTIESIESTTFKLPTIDDIGDFTSGKLLRDAARLSTRAAAGPFRSFGKIDVEPRPYQLVPLMMALKLDPVRILIADDVGVGKTIEAATIARELLDRGDIKNICVLCPPPLAEQWQKELAEKFNIDAELILSSTIKRLERDLRVGESVFDRYNHTIVSIDFIKSPRRVDDFIIKAPEFVIVDEVHGCALSAGVGKGQQQRYKLIKKLGENPNRNIVLVTATPHSGNELAFRSILGLLDNSFAEIPIQLDKLEKSGIRKKLSQQLVQRRRADIRHYLKSDTKFPKRLDKESTYTFSEKYNQLFSDILDFASDFVSVKDSGKRDRRVRYWSALALLRCVSSSPAAAAATLRSRAKVDLSEDDQIEEIGRNTVLDQENMDESFTIDFSPGSDIENSPETTRKKLLEFAKRAESIKPFEDHKLQGAIKEVKSLLKEGYHPVVFCRFIDTAEYVANRFREAFPDKIKVESITGLLPPAEREIRINSLAESSDQYVLVSTDCLSEGINLQKQFNAVLHYDLAWNPTRHEQREGRIDRFGQDKDEVRVITYYGKDNPIDGVILDILIKKHKKIKSDLGVTVAVPGTSEQVIEAIFEGTVFKERTRKYTAQLSLDFIDDLEPKKIELHKEWDNARDREKATRSIFAQKTIKPEDVALELKKVQSAIGRSEDVSNFLQTVLHSSDVPFDFKNEKIQIYISNETPRSFRQAIGFDEPISGKFNLPVGEHEKYLSRTSPIIEGLANWVIDQALDPVVRDKNDVASRCGVAITSKVDQRTTLLLVRLRYRLLTNKAKSILCEEILPLACTGKPDFPEWLSEEKSEELLNVTPEQNVSATAVSQQIGLLLSQLPKYQDALAQIAQKQSAKQLETHEEIRKAVRFKGQTSIEPVLPVDILGAYILIPRIR